MYHTEEFSLDYKTLDELSYWDTQEKYIRLYKKDSLQGYLYVYKDSEQNGREYICINYEIVYLDTLNKK